MTATAKNVFLMFCGSPQFRFPDEWMTVQSPAGRVVTDTHINKWWSSACPHQLRSGDTAVLVATKSGKVMGAFEVVSEPVEDRSAPSTRMSGRGRCCCALSCSLTARWRRGCGTSV